MILISLLSVILNSPQAFAQDPLPPAVSSCETALAQIVKVSWSANDAHLKNLYSQRSPQTQRAIDDILTLRHYQRDMSFQKKNPQTGRYDQFVQVPVNGRVVTLSEEKFSALVTSTEPVLRALRGLLQRVYSEPEWTVASLGLESLPPKEAELILHVLNESIYFEPSLRAPQMRDYPFLAVSGMDGAIVDPQDPKPVFFEMNLGTPSGLSNNLQLLNDLSAVDPEVADLIAKRRPKDNTFDLLKSVIDANAKSWTGRGDGISVVIGPGVYNGAHPDVAAIASFSGMPLVQASDLFVDEQGWVRWQRGPGHAAPVVTGIYARSEESFLLQAEANQVPMISPQYANNAELGQKLGVRLRPGAIYDFVYDQDGQVIDVERDEAGQPRIQRVWDAITAPGDLVKAVLAKRIYISSIGGRVADDKRLFRTTAQYLAKTPSVEKERWARPIASLNQDEFHKFVTDPDRYVVKEPNNSGGVGIRFMKSLPASEKAEWVQKVLAHPLEYEVQEVSSLVTIDQAAGFEWVPTVIDLRLFVLLDAAGKVHAGPNSVLLRTAPKGSLYSNTSRGGGYGILAVLRSEEAAESAAVEAERTSTGGRLTNVLTDVSSARREQDVIAGLTDLKALMHSLSALDDPRQPPEEMKQRALSLSYDLRGWLDLMQPRAARLISVLRAFSEGAETNAGLELIEELHDFFMRILRKEVFENSAGRLSQRVNHWIHADSTFFSLLINQNEKPWRDSRNPLHRHLTLKALAQPEVTYVYKVDAKWRREKVELAEYVDSQDLHVKAVIDDVRRSGGQVRFLRQRLQSVQDPHVEFYSWEAPYFWVNTDPRSASYLVPVIGIDLSRSQLPGLMHEYAHFKFWREKRDKYLAEGLDAKSATERALSDVWTDEGHYASETVAVSAEMVAELSLPRGPFFTGTERPNEFFERGYVNRITYPEFQAVRHLLHRLRWGNEAQQRSVNLEQLRAYLRDMVSIAKTNKERALTYWQERGNAEEIAYWTQVSVAELLLEPLGMERLIFERTDELFLKFLSEI